MIDTTRKSQRHRLTHPVEVRCDTWDQFRRLYTHNISQGGFFLSTSAPPPVDSDLAIKITLPRGHSLSLAGKVVHAITPERAEREGLKAGAGVRFTDINEEKQRLIQALIELSRLDQGSASTPGPTAAPPPGPSQPPPAPPAPQPPPAPSAAAAAPLKPVEAVRKISTDELFSDLPQGGSTGSHPIVSDFLLQSAKENMAAHRYQKAAAEFEQYLSGNPTNTEAKVGLYLAQGNQHLASGDKKKAAEKYREVLKLQPSHTEASVLLQKAIS